MYARCAKRVKGLDTCKTARGCCKSSVWDIAQSTRSTVLGVLDDALYTSGI